MDFLTDPVSLSFLGKVAGAAVMFFLAIGFIPGLLIGWLIGKAT